MPPASREPTWRPAWLVGVGIGLVACVAFALIPAGTDASTTTYQVVSGIIVLAMLAVVARLPRGSRGVWAAAWGYAALAFAGDLAYYAEAAASVEHASWSHALYFASYGCALVAVMLLVRRLQPGRDVEAAIDTLIIAVAMTSVVYLAVIEPTIELYGSDTREMLLAVAYPVVDLVLLAGVIRALVGAREPNPSVVILLAAFAVTFLADLLYAYVGAGGLGGIAPAWLDTLYLVALVALASAPGAPGADLTHATAPVDAEPGARGRTLALSVGALMVLWRFGRLLGVVDRQSRRLSALARIDALTGLPNRRTLDHHIDRMEQDVRADAVTVAMLDLDHFKQFNDTYGHAAGDTVLAACAQAWSAELVEASVPFVLARYGGEEFACVMTGLDLDDASPVLDRVRMATPRGHSVSIGCAQVEPSETIFAAMGRADRALYRAKRSGRNRVVADGRDLAEADTP